MSDLFKWLRYIWFISFNAWSVQDTTFKWGESCKSGGFSTTFVSMENSLAGAYSVENALR